MHRVTTLVHLRLAAKASSGTNIPRRCNGRSRRGLCGHPQSVRGSETMFGKAFRALFHHPGSLWHISMPTLLFAAFALIGLSVRQIFPAVKWENSRRIPGPPRAISGYFAQKSASAAESATAGTASEASTPAAAAKASTPAAAAESAAAASAEAAAAGTAPKAAAPAAAETAASGAAPKAAAAG